MIRTTMGQLLVNEALPPDMRDYTRELDKKGISKLFGEIAERYPDEYRDIAKKLSDVGRNAATASGGHSFSMRHLRTTRAALLARQRLNRKIDSIMENDKLNEDQKEEQIVNATAAEHERLLGEVYDEALAAGNPLAKQVRSGARGKPPQLKRLIGGDMLYVDHRDRPVPFPVTRTYAEGLTPAEWFAGAFGARKGLVDTKFATQDAGFFAKQLNQLAHRLLVVAEDAEGSADAASLRGMPVDVTDAGNEGALLASPVGDYTRNTPLTAKILADLQNQGIKRILVRSPTVGGPASGVYSRDIGIREKGRARLGEIVGQAAAQAISERITQGGLESKHAGGLKGSAKTVRGFDYLNSQIQAPKQLKGAAAHAEVDGHVDRVEPAPHGGQYLWIEGTRHYVSPGFALHVKPGDNVEAGDVLSEGIPHPGKVVQHKGVGEGRRYFTQQFSRALQEAGIPYERRNVELIARGLIDHVEMLEEDDDHSPGDLASYSALESSWVPRQGSRMLPIKQALGRYLEQPVLHYSIGTKIRPSTVRDLEEFGVSEVNAHDEAPPFQPRMVRAMEGISHDQDWMTRMLGSNQQRGLLDATHRNMTSNTQNTSFVPALAAGEPFSRQWPNNVLTQPKKP